MLRNLIISIFISGSCFSQDSLVVNDGSIWFTKSSCSIDIRCYDNLDDIVKFICSDSLTIVSLQLLENEFEKSSKDSFTECRAQKLADYFKFKHNIDIPSITATSVMMNAEEMKAAISENNIRTIVLVLGYPIKKDL